MYSRAGRGKACFGNFETFKESSFYLLMLEIGETIREKLK